MAYSRLETQDGPADDTDLLGGTFVDVVLGVERLEHHPRRVGVGYVLDPRGDEPHAVPDHEDAGRHRHLAAHVDQDADAARQQRLHRVTVARDHLQALGLGPELVADQAVLPGVIGVDWVEEAWCSW